MSQSDVIKDILKLSRLKRFLGLKEKVRALRAGKIKTSDQKLIESLVWSGLSNDIELISAYIDLGISINASFRGKTALGVAAHIPFPNFLNALISLGANVNHLDSENATPLILAARMGINQRQNREHYLPHIKIFVEHACDINAADMFHRTALDYCCKASWDEAANILLDHGAKLELCDEKGWWALRSAVESHDSTILKRLLNQKKATAIVSIVNDGACIIDYAAALGRVQHIEVMIAAGVADRLSDGRSAMDVAKEKRSAIQKLL